MWAPAVTGWARRLSRRGLAGKECPYPTTIRFTLRPVAGGGSTIGEALTYWLDAQARLFESFPSQPLTQQFQSAYESLTAEQDWVLIHRLRQVLGWPRERFDAMVEELRDGRQVEL